MPFPGLRRAHFVRTLLTTSRLLASMLQGRKRRQRALITARQSEGLEARVLLTSVTGDDGHSHDADGEHCAGDGHDHSSDQHNHEHDQGCNCANCQGAGQDHSEDHVHMHAFFAPDTPQSVVDAHEAEHGHDSTGFSEFNADDRWTNTATDGGGIALGEAITLTWSIAPDGTNIPGFNGEGTAPSDLVETFRGYYSDIHMPSDTDYVGEAWFIQIEASLNEWSDVSGITYVYEPNDDGATFSSSSGISSGVVGVRGDVRIGGHFIDGNSGILAYNFFPTVGDMVIDTADNFYANLSNNSLRLRNVIAHEAGHGVGFSHVESNNASFLMEPFVSTSFDGPQLDDILAAHRNYGDVNEKDGANETAGTATDLGTIGDGVTVSIGTQADDTRVEANDTDFVSIDDDSDIDVFSFTVSANSSIDVNLSPEGPTYSQGRQGQNNESPYDASAQSDLSFEVLDTDGTTVLTTASVNGIGSSESLNAFDLNVAGTYFVRISGADNAVQMYQLDVSVSIDAPTSSVSLSANDASLAEGDSGTTNFTYTVTRTGDLSLLATIDYVTAGIGVNAANAADFGGAFPTGTVTFDPNVSTQTFTVGVSGDIDVEVSEAFSVTLVSPSAGVLIGTGTQNGTIINDDSIVSIVATDAVKVEGDSGTTSYTFTITRTGVTNIPDNVSWNVTGNGATADDFLAGIFPAGVAQFAANQTSQTITIDVAGDLDVEIDEGFTVNVLSSTSGATVAAGTASGTIVNDDTDFSIAATDANKSEGDNGSTAFTFTVTRTGDTSNAASATYSVASNAADAADFGGTLPSGTANFVAGQSTATITVSVSGDSDVEADEGFTVTLDSVSGNGEITTASADGTIVNDDVQIDIALTATDADKAEGDSGTTSFTFLVTRTGMTSGTSSATFTVSGSGANGADGNDFGGALPTGTVSFAAGETQQTITVNVSGDTTFEVDEDFAVTLSDAVDAEIIGATAAGVIRNDDLEPEVFDITADNASRNEADGAFTFSVTRSGNTSDAGSVDYSVSGSGSNAANADDFGGAFPSGTASFAAGETSVVVTINVSDDADVEANEGFTVTLNTDENPSANGTIINDDASDSGVSLVDGVLIINGDSGNDYVSLRGSRNSIRVYTYSYATRTSTSNAFSQSDVTSISVDTGDGNDRVYFNGRIHQSSTINLGNGDDRASGGRGSDNISGGAGNDVIYGNNGNDNIDGGDGNDYLRGGNHNDIIRGGNGNNWSYGDNGHDILIGGDNFDYQNGGRGRDILIGGGGRDWMDGSGASDILIGGSTVYDNDDAALSAILGVWTSRTSYNNRVATIRSGSGRLGGVKLEANTTVLDDGARDIMIGNRGRDWYFGDASGADRDQIFRGFREVVDQLP